jgi:hypothetical protein
VSIGNPDARTYFLVVMLEPKDAWRALSREERLRWLESTATRLREWMFGRPGRRILWSRSNEGDPVVMTLWILDNEEAAWRLSVETETEEMKRYFNVSHFGDWSASHYEEAFPAFLAGL